MSIVATDHDLDVEEPATEPGQIEWTRTPEQERLISAHRNQVDVQYVALNADPILVELLLDDTIIGSTRFADLLEYKRLTRVFQLYANTDGLVDADQIPHPGGLVMDTVGIAPQPIGQREIRGFMVGRWVMWVLQSGRMRWDSISGQMVKQTGINHGGAPRRS